MFSLEKEKKINKQVGSNTFGEYIIQLFLAI